MAAGNGTSMVRGERAATKAAADLVRRDYATRVLANLGEHRVITDEFIAKSIGEFDPNRVTISDLWKMREDYMIKMGLHYSKAPIIRADWDIRCEDPMIRAAAMANWRDIHAPITRVGLNMLDFGFQGAVKQFELGKIDATYEDPETGDVRQVWDDPDVLPVRMGEPIPLPPDNTRPKLDKGRFDGILTPFKLDTRSGGQEDNHLPVDWCLWYANEFEEQIRNWFGMSRIKPAYRHWYSYWYHFHMRDRHAEMDADPALQIWYPPGEAIPDPNDIDPETNRPRVISNKDEALRIGAALRGGATIAWPSDVFVDEQGKAAPVYLWKAEFLKGGENLNAFNELLADLEIGKLRATLVPEQALVEAKRGTSSRNAAASYEDIHTQSLEMTAQYLDHIHTQYVLRPWVEANFGKDAPKVEKVTTGFQEEDMTLVSSLLQAAFNADPNALPIKWEDVLEQLNVPTYSKKEQEEREEAIAEAQREAEAQAAEQAAQGGGAPPGQLPGEPGPLPGETGAQQLAASQDSRRTRPRKYEREVIHLSSKKSTAPAWAKREGKRRDRNVSALAERLHDVAKTRYEAVFAVASTTLAEMDGELQLSIGGAVTTVIDRIVDGLERLLGGHNRRVQGELAGIYHATGAAELTRLGLSAESWDVGRDEVQEWAREHAAELVQTIDKTVIEQHVRPWLTQALSSAGYGDSPTGIPVDTLELAAQLRDKFSNYPQWMAERLVRTESMRGYNLSAADMWERVGVAEVDLFDGLGGKSGLTDEECLARNGQRVDLDTFRQLTLKEHPNGTLGAVPVTENVQLKPLGPGLIQAEPAMSLSLYGVTDAGLILSEAEVGRALANG